LKLLFDANISRQLVDLLSDLFPGSSHVALEGLDKAGDQAVWQFAIGRDFMIVSKDEDFHQLAFLKGPPPKVVWVRLGNCSTEEIAQTIRSGAAIIEAFGVEEEASFLVLRRRAP